jgi:hypothetical protein
VGGPARTRNVLDSVAQRLDFAAIALGEELVVRSPQEDEPHSNGCIARLRRRDRCDCLLGGG